MRFLLLTLLVVLLPLAAVVAYDVSSPIGTFQSIHPEVDRNDIVLTVSDASGGVLNSLDMAIDGVQQVNCSGDYTINPDTRNVDSLAITCGTYAGTVEFLRIDDQYLVTLNREVTMGIVGKN